MLHSLKNPYDLMVIIIGRNGEQGTDGGYGFPRCVHLCFNPRTIALCPSIHNFEKKKNQLVFQFITPLSNVAYTQYSVAFEPGQSGHGNFCQLILTL